MAIQSNKKNHLTEIKSLEQNRVSTEKMPRMLLLPCAVLSPHDCLYPVDLGMLMNLARSGKRTGVRIHCIAGPQPSSPFEA